VVFNRFLAPKTVDGEILALFVMAVAAAEAVVALAIFVALFRDRSSIDVNRMNSMKG
jgi:NADH:ubiquinone oxidoreductase subunit K